MRKRSIICLVCVILAVVALTVALTGCKETGETGASAEVVRELGVVPAQSIAYDGSTLSFVEVTHADYYSLVFNDEEPIEVVGASYAVQRDADFTVTITAMANATNTKYISSTKSSSSSFVYVAPPVLSINGKNFEWNEIESAKGYVVKSNGSERQGYQQETSFAIVKPTGDEQSTLQVKALFEDEKIFTSWSVAAEARILSTPQNLSYDGHILTWDSVLGATAYEVVISKNGYEIKKETAMDNHLVFGTIDDGTDLPITANESFLCQITAKGEQEENILDSNMLSRSFTLVDSCTAPIFDTNSGNLVWGKVSEADYYTLSIQAESANEATLVNVRFNAYSGLDTAGSYLIKVKPMNDNGTIYSDWSDESLINIRNGLNIQWDKEQITWELLAGDVSYYAEVSRVANGGKNILEREGLGKDVGSYNARDKLRGAGRYEVNIFAVYGESSTDYTLPSEPITIYVLPQPSAYYTSNNAYYDEDYEIDVKFNSLQLDLGSTVYGEDDVFVWDDFGIQYRVGFEGSDFNEITPVTGTAVKVPVPEALAAREGATLTLLVRVESSKANAWQEQKRLVVLNSLDANYATYEQEITRLAAPVTTLTSSQLSWGNVQKATGYMVKITDMSDDGQPLDSPSLFTTYDTRYDLSTLKTGQHRIEVAAIGNGNVILSSLYSNSTFVVKLPAPTNIKVGEEQQDEQRQVTWDAASLTIDGHEYTASGYVVKIGTNLTQVDAAFTTIGRNEISVFGTAISVYAVGSVSEDGTASTLSSSWSNVGEATYLVFRLPSPDSVSVTDTGISWLTVDKASSYRVWDGDNLIAEVESNSLRFDDERAAGLLGDGKEKNDLSLQVEAVGTGKYCNSNRSVAYGVTVLPRVSPSVSPYTGEISWNAVRGAQGYAVEVIYADANNKIYDATYTLDSSTTSFKPEYQNLNNEMVTVNVWALGDGGIQYVSSLKTGTSARLVQLDDLSTMTEDIAVAVLPDSRKIQITITESDPDSLLGNGYGIYIAGVEIELRRYFEDENLYTEVGEGSGIYSYIMTIGEVSYNKASKEYTFTYSAASSGTYVIRLRARGGNYSGDLTQEADIISYCSSGFIDLKTITLLEPFADGEVAISTQGLTTEQIHEGKRYLVFINKPLAKGYEYSIAYKDSEGKDVATTDKIIVDADGEAKMRILFDCTKLTVVDTVYDIFEIFVTIKTLGDGINTFDSADTRVESILVR